MRLALTLVALVGSSAAAEDTAPLHPVEVLVRDPSGAIKDGEIAAALEAGPVANVLARCPHAANSDVLVWLVFDHGKVVAADAGGSSDRKLEACVLTAVKRATLASSKARVVATVELVTPLVAMMAAVQRTQAGNSAIGVGTGSAAPQVGSSSPRPAIATRSGSAAVPQVATGSGSAAVPQVATGSGSAAMPAVGTGHGSAAAPVGTSSGPAAAPQVGAGSGAALAPPAGGDSASVPPELTVTVATLDSGALKPEQIDRVVRAKAATFRGCYDIARRAQPEISGKFVYRFEIDATGGVTVAKARLATPPPRLDDCLVRVLKSLKFPASTGASIVSYPLTFTAK